MQERVIERICDRLLLNKVIGFDDEDDKFAFDRPSTLAQKLDAKIKGCKNSFHQRNSITYS